MAKAKQQDRLVKAAQRQGRRLEDAVRRAKQRLDAWRQAQTPTPVEDYVLAGPDGKALRLSEAFGDKEDLVVVHNMGTGCVMCTTWADGLDGVVDHLEDRAAFLVTSPDPVKVQRAFAKARGWRFRMASSAGTTFFRDLGFEDDDGHPWPGVTTFRKGRGGRVERVASASFGPGDGFSPVFELMPLLHGGQGDWWPRFAYGRRHGAKRAPRR